MSPLRKKYIHRLFAHLSVNKSKPAEEYDFCNKSCRQKI